MKSILTMLAVLSIATFANAATPSINSVSGTISTGQILTVSGSNMVQENNANWLNISRSAFGFEGSSPSADGYCYGGTCEGTYDSSVALSGSKSAKFSVAGASSQYPNFLESFNAFSLYTQDFYGRTYFRYTNNSGVWPDNVLKFIDIQGTSNNIYIQPVGTTGPPDRFIVANNGSGTYGAIPGGPIQSDRWYLLEWQYSNSAGQVKVWIDNQLIITSPLTPTTQNFFDFGIVNTFSTPSNFAMDLRLDNMALSSTRVYPSSLIEISNSPTYGQGTVKYQAPVSMSDGTIKFKADLSGLGSGPYYLWITNNGQTRSAAYNLSGGSAGGTTSGSTTGSTTGSTSTSTPSTGTAAGTILLQENFNDANMSSRGWYDNTATSISTTEHATGSTSSGAFTFAAGGTGTTNGGGSMRRQFAESDSVYISYWQKYSTNWQEQPGGVGHHEIYLLTNQDGAYSNLAFTHTTAYLEHWGTPGQSVSLTPHISFQDGANTDQSKINVDLTQSTENRSADGCNGVLDSFTSQCYNAGNGSYWNGKFLTGGPATFGLGQWHKVEAYIKLNSIVNGKGVANGTVTYWLDGQQIFNSNSVLMRTGQYPNMKFNQLVIGPYMGNGAPANQTFWLDDLQIATARSTSSTSTAPAKPANLKVTKVQ